jgi:two-component system response regulator YesN
MIIIIRFDKSSQISMNDIIKYFNDIIIMVEEFMRIDIRFGLSQLIQNPKDIKLGYEEAKESLSKIIIKGSELHVYNVLKDEGNQVFSLDVDQYIGKICELTFDGESGQANNQLNELYDKLVSSNCSFEQCKMYMLVICSSIIRKAVRYHTDQDFNAMEKEAYELIQSAITMFSLVSIGNHTIDHLRNSCKDKKDFKNELVKKADECIRNHYKEDLTLQFISQELYLNSSYLSRAYKKWTGNTITEAINMYRISKAKGLLITSTLKIYEVAQAVGIQDAAYFTNVFLKYVGQNPTEYRQEHT